MEFFSNQLTCSVPSNSFQFELSYTFHLWKFLIFIIFFLSCISVIMKLPFFLCSFCLMFSVSIFFYIFLDSLSILSSNKCFWRAIMFFNFQNSFFVSDSSFGIEISGEKNTSV